MYEALEAILLNTINRNFDGDEIYKVGVLSNIRFALGSDEYDLLVKKYKVKKKN